MRIFIGLIIVFICCNSCSKKLTVENPNYNIEQKAKLLTVSEFGVADPKIILEEVFNQKLRYIDFGYKNFLFMEIVLSQNYWKDSKWNGIANNLYCKRIIVYNKITKRYYNLKRGSSLDVSNLVEDIETYELRPLIFISKGKVESAIDLFCVFEFAENKSLNFFDCITGCDDNVGSIGQ
jgi:hypothetical protein